MKRKTAIDLCLAVSAIALIFLVFFWCIEDSQREPAVEVDQLRSSATPAPAAEHAKLPPWSILCDGKGQFSFASKYGTPIKVYSSRAEAVAARDYIQHLYKTRIDGTLPPAKEDTIKWNVCNDTQPLKIAQQPITWATSPASTSILMLQPAVDPCLIFKCGSGMVTIHYNDGHVDYKDFTPDAAARAFWEAITKSFPEVRRRIADQQKKGAM